MRIISWITVCDLSLLPVSECPEMAKSLVELVVPTSDRVTSLSPERVCLSWAGN